MSYHQTSINVAGDSGSSQKLKVVHTVKDPVHGWIQFSEAERHVLDTPIVQNLRFISQLSQVSEVYPGGVHNRFIHSLGAMHVAGKYCRHLISPRLALSAFSISSSSFSCCSSFSSSPPAPPGQIVSSNSAFWESGDAVFCEHLVELGRMAALLHDVSHMPFSHTFDRAVYSRMYPDCPDNGHDRARIELLRSDRCPLKGLLAQHCGVDAEEVIQVWQSKLGFFAAAAALPEKEEKEEEKKDENEKEDKKKEKSSYGAFLIELARLCDDVVAAGNVENEKGWGLLRSRLAAAAGLSEAERCSIGVQLSLACVNPAGWAAGLRSIYTVIGAVVQGPLGADRIDFTMRDAHFTGMDHLGTIAADRLIYCSSIQNNKLVYDAKCMVDVLAFLQGRASMYETVYGHKTAMAADLLVQRMLCAAVEPYRLEERARDPELHAQLNDYVLLGQILSFSSSSSFLEPSCLNEKEKEKRGASGGPRWLEQRAKEAQEWAQRLVRRELPKLVHEEKIFGPPFVSSLSSSSSQSRDEEQKEDQKDKEKQTVRSKVIRAVDPEAFAAYGILFQLRDSFFSSSSSPSSSPRVLLLTCEQMLKRIGHVPQPAFCYERTYRF